MGTEHPNLRLRCSPSKSPPVVAACRLSAPPNIEGAWGTASSVGDKNGKATYYGMPVAGVSRTNGLTKKKRILLTSLNYYHSLIYLLQLENKIFMLELLKLADLSPWTVFKAV